MMLFNVQSLSLALARQLPLHKGAFGFVQINKSISVNSLCQWSDRCNDLQRYFCLKETKK